MYAPEPLGPPKSGWIAGSETIWRSLEAGSRAATAPRPVAGVFAEAGANGVENDVSARLRKVLLGFDERRALACAEEVAASVVAIVEGLRVETV